MAADDLGGGLTAHRTDDRCEVRFPHGVSGVRFDRVEGADGPRARAVLWYGGGRVTPDVSIQPAAVLREIDQTAAEHGVDPGGWRVRVLRVLKAWHGGLDWVGNEPSHLLAAVGAVTHPLLGAAYQRGHAPIDEVPRWASPVLRCHTPGAAAAVLEPRANRRLARSLAASLVRHEPPASVDLRPLALAVMGAGVVSIDELANVLDTPHGGPPDEPDLPDPDQVKEVRRMLALYPGDRATALLVDCATRHRVAELADAMRQLWWVHERAPRPFPSRLSGVVDVCRQLVPVLAPAGGTAALAPAPAPAPAAAWEDDDHPERFDDPRLAPEVEEAPDIVRWHIQPALRGVDGFEREGIRYLVPTSRAELERWGDVLLTCVGEYADPVIRGVSWIIGLECEGRVIGCVEVRAHGRTVRQALGARNQPLPPAMLRSVLRSLELLHVIRPLSA